MKRLYIKLLCLIWVVLCVSCHNDLEDAFYDDEHICYAQSDDTTLFVHPFVHEGQQYVVLPSYWDTSKLVISICDGLKTIWGQEKSCYQLCDGDKMKQVNMIKSKLPTIFGSSDKCIVNQQINE